MLWIKRLFSSEFLVLLREEGSGLVYLICSKYAKHDGMGSILLDSYKHLLHVFQ